MSGSAKFSPAEGRPSLGEPGYFDVLVGSQTQRRVLAEEISTCLVDRGFSILRLQEVGDVAEACEEIRGADVGEKLGRLPLETEEGYLGRAGSAKVMWLDQERTPLSEYGSLWKGEGILAVVAEILQPYSEDALGCPITERTPALACASMLEGDELIFENPSASSQEIQDYYFTWARGVLRAVLFLSPAGQVLLKLKSLAVVGGAETSYQLQPTAGTLLLLREDTFEYSFIPTGDGPAFWLQSFFLKPGPQFSLVGELEGDIGLLHTVGDGPPPPSDPSALVAVVALGIQSALKISDHHQEWAAYTGGTDGQLEMPFQRFEYLPYYSEEVDNPLGTTYVKHFSVQEGIDLFDNRAFEISNAESEALDPMFRQVMEVGYMGIHQLGITKKYCNTNPIHASVSVGCDKQEWLQMPGVTRSVATNNQLAICANRFNYVFNLKGGSYVCDTACSSTLVAVHLGKTNLLEQRWDPLEWHLGMGTSLTLTVGSFIGGCASHMLSPGGRCFTFNATANGYNRGDGTSGMVLKVGPNDQYRMAYLRGSQMGQDGRSASMSAPNGPAQEKCVWGALREARMTPPESTTWDCHGTGTSLGDPIEVGAVRKVQIKMKRLEPLMIASSKSNFGHLEGSAAGIAMNKCVMVVIMNICAPTSHLKTLNPHLDHASFDAIFTTEANPYKYKQGHCQVSSFGVGGTNGHAIFWGKKGREAPINYHRLFLNKLMASPPPIVQDGSSPADWEFSGPALDSNPGDRYKVVFSKDTLTGEEKFTYERLEDFVEQIDFYCTSGSHNDWNEERMIDGDVPFLFFQLVSVPKDGLVEFRILVEGDQERVIAPRVKTPKCTTPILGPRKDLSTSWLAKGVPGSTLRIELLAPPKGICSVIWLPVKDGDE